MDQKWRRVVAAGQVGDQMLPSLPSAPQETVLWWGEQVPHQEITGVAVNWHSVLLRTGAEKVTHDFLRIPAKS